MTKPFSMILKNLVCVVLFASFGVVSAGSYDDFFSAIKQDNAGKVKEILTKGFDANTPDLKGQTGLHLALLESAPKSALVLIGWPRTDVNKLNGKGESALMLAALTGQTMVVKQLIGKGGDVNKTEWTPLHYAATGGHSTVISVLLESNAYIDAESPNGTTPLMMAARYGSSESVHLLLKEGADTGVKNQLGLTALDFAERANRPDAIRAIATSIQKKYPTGKW